MDRTTPGTKAAPAEGAQEHDVRSTGDVTRGVNAPYYPTKRAHTWNAFPVLAIEDGGHGDIMAVNPYTGDRLTVLVEGSDDMYVALRRLVDAIEAHRFLDR